MYRVSNVYLSWIYRVYFVFTCGLAANFQRIFIRHLRIHRNTHKKILLLLYLHRGSRIARITNTTKVVHDMCTNMPMFVIPMKLARFLWIQLVLLAIKYVSVSPRMMITFFSAEKMSQNYSNYLTYANNLLFFLPERHFFAHIFWHTVYHLYAVMRETGAKEHQKKNRRKGFALYALISHVFFSVWCFMFDVYSPSRRRPLLPFCREDVPGVRCTMYGAWCTVYGVRCMVYGVWCTVYKVYFWAMYIVAMPKVRVSKRASWKPAWVRWCRKSSPQQKDLTLLLR